MSQASARQSNNNNDIDIVFDRTPGQLESQSMPGLISRAESTHTTPGQLDSTPGQTSGALNGITSGALNRIKGIDSVASKKRQEVQLPNLLGSSSHGSLNTLIKENPENKNGKKFELDMVTRPKILESDMSLN